VTGFDDIRFSRQCFPGLTTFCQPMGQVISKIIERIQKQNFEPSVEYLECPLIIRESC
jgi:DNA-binding LacI/PurR family transcriptional regulator